MHQKHKNLLKWILQITVAAVAIYFVAGEVDLEELKTTILKTKVEWLFLAFIAFNFSKILSALRLNHFYKVISIHLSSILNVKLYYLGMLYNQFLPGGIGGDGYKIYLLNVNQEVKIKSIILATFLDRLTGFVALGFLVFILSLFGSLSQQFPEFILIVAGFALFIYPFYYLLIYLFFKNFLPVLHLTNLKALGVQTLQLICVFFILLSLGVQANYIDYMTLFLITSVATALPASLPGGFGVREFVFTFGYSYFSIQQTESVALASLFFFITLMSSAIGLAFLRLNLKAKTNS